MVFPERNAPSAREGVMKKLMAGACAALWIFAGSYAGPGAGPDADLGANLSADLGAGLGVTIAGALAQSDGQAPQASAGETARALFEAYWASEMRADPFLATTSGEFAYNDRLPQVAPADYARLNEARADFMARLEALDRAALSTADRRNADLMAFILRHDLALAAFDPWRIPFLADSGFHNDVGYVVSAAPFRNEKDYTDYLARLEAMPGYIDQHIENMRRGLADGFTQPREIMDNILPSFAAQIKDNAAAHPLYEPFNAIPETIPARRRTALKRRANALLTDDVIPAFSRLYDFMREEYAPAARDSVGADGLPDGEAYYEALVRYYTTLDDVTADEIHAIGLREVARIRAEMNAVIRETGFRGDFSAFLDFLRTDEQFYARTPEALLERAAWLAKDADGRLPGYFRTLPRQPYSVEPVPAEIAPNYTTGRYVGAPLDAARGGQYWVNTYNLDKRPLYALPALTLHEAVPGHHLQIALALEIEGAPAFRAQFYPHAFGEGWALYAEKLGVEMDFYQTPYDDFGRLSYEMWRACRLVIDTGLHAKGWTRERAIDYLASNTALSLHNVQTEVDRYIAWPGQALAYKMGELTIWELRRKAERELGEAFDIRDFHDAVLVNGGLPLEMLRTEIDAYIAAAKTR